jgi:hypothetical protein
VQSSIEGSIQTPRHAELFELNMRPQTPAVKGGEGEAQNDGARRPETRRKETANTLQLAWETARLRRLTSHEEIRTVLSAGLKEQRSIEWRGPKTRGERRTTPTHAQEETESVEELEWKLSRNPVPGKRLRPLTM